MAKGKTLKSFKKFWQIQTRGKSKTFRNGLKLGLLATTNNKIIRDWIRGQR